MKQISPISISPSRGSKLVIAAGAPVERGEEYFDRETGCQATTELVQYDRPS